MSITGGGERRTLGARCVLPLQEEEGEEEEREPMLGEL